MSNKKAIIIYAHPYDGSYSNAMKKAAEQGLAEADDKSYEVIDLFEDNFDSMGHIENNESFSKQMSKYKKMFNETNQVVIVFPVWWSGMPAIMKSFFDNLFPYGTEKFEELERVNIYTTSATPNTVAKLVLKFPVKHQLKSLAKRMGARKISYRNLDKIACSAERRNNYLKRITKEVKNG